MTPLHAAATEAPASYAQRFAAEGWAKRGPGFVRELRQAGLDGWSASAQKLAVHPAAVAREVTEGEIAAFRLADALEMVFVDGRHHAGLSRLAGAPRGLLTPLSVALERPTELVEMHLGRHAGDEGAAALNAAFFSDGAVVDLEPGTQVAPPIHLLHISTGAQAASHHVRHLIVAGSQSEATLVESYIGLGGASTLTTAVTELLAGPSAHIHHATLQRETLHGEHHAKLVVRVGRDATVSETALGIGASRSTRTTDARLAESGAEVQLDALLLATAAQEMAFPTFVDHAAARTTSRQLVKAVLDGRARGSFTGNVTVRADAQKTNAEQTNRNLLLSDGARMETTPQLEINADDVKCSHGSTIGQLSADALFFLRSRGIGPEPAKLILTKAFAHEVIERAPPVLRPTLEALLTQWFACRAVAGAAS